MPPKTSFRNDITSEEISDEDYNHVQTVWRSLKIENLGQYHDLYMKTDILLLADIFQNFQDLCLDFYKFDPAHCLTLPSFAWSAALHKSNINLELISDPDMYLFFEEGIRGGISVITKSIAKLIINI